jgi:hypothetical protein
MSVALSSDELTQDEIDALGELLIWLATVQLIFPFLYVDRSVIFVRF